MYNYQITGGALGLWRQRAADRHRDEVVKYSTVSAVTATASPSSAAITYGNDTNWHSTQSWKLIVCRE